MDGSCQSNTLLPTVDVKNIDFQGKSGKDKFAKLGVLKWI